jgi:predicted dehydrogenase
MNAQEGGRLDEGPGGAIKGTPVAAIEELIACIEGGRGSRSGGKDGRAALEVALAVYQSNAHGGARVALPLEDRDLLVHSR